MLHGVVLGLDFYLRSVLNHSQGRPQDFLFLLLLFICLIWSVFLLTLVLNVILSFFVAASFALDIPEKVPAL